MYAFVKTCQVVHLRFVPFTLPHTQTHTQTHTETHTHTQSLNK